ncbi:MAG: winged helix-turn-helix transcriptional regulator [Thermococci archaeon]|nr:winged helix-turn-helix transcriptional regulator [Thermococci archaeon]
MSTPFWVILPSNAVIVDLSSVPLRIHGNTLLMPRGNQNVSYILQYSTSTTSSTTTSSSSTSTSTSMPTSSSTSTRTSSVSTSTGTNTNTGSSGTSTTHSTSCHTSATSSTTPSAPSNTTAGSTGGGSGGTRNVLVGIACAAAGAGLIAVALSKRRKRPSREEFIERINSPELDLNEDEKRALLYVYDRGGRASQAEVREALELPKTTAWRMFRRLEEKGLIRVIKRKKGNVIELIWKPEK